MEGRAEYSRRSWITRSCCAAAGVGLPAGMASERSRPVFRILPLEGKVYSESFLHFANSSTFHSVADAVESVRDSDLEFAIVRV